MNERRILDLCLRQRFLIYIALFCAVVFVLGHSQPVLAGGKTAAEAISQMDEILGDPEEFATEIRLNVQDFIADHFGSLAIATGFSIVVRGAFR
ncbi:hypothetical protein PN499_23345 [Kamptonema animale CS-326]|jgi:hypothetical protein|uniref:hypothetical protein n=1 Tax=Kamptonema animale TaxID=92934 RepID=UPI00232BAD84|nr:hypothetical protein [Kamptonema animale]MDB9514141.1 hypothetical protein [Kamptonema animale CS-326]